MTTASPFLILNSSCERAAGWLSRQLENADLNVLQTFNSSDVRAAGIESLCPHHNTQECSCRVLIFLVYQKGRPAPLSLIVYGYDEYTLFYVVDTPQQRADPYLEAVVRQALIPDPVRLFDPADQTN